MAESHPYHSDRPISSCSGDVLGRAEVAAQIVKDIKAWEGTDSLVLGLYGEWGEGKTSFKNLVVECLQSDSSDSPQIIQLNPWQLSGTGNITGLLFNDLAAVLTDVLPPKEKAGLLEKLARYTKLLSLAGTVAECLGSAADVFGAPEIGVAARTTAVTINRVSDIIENGKQSADEMSAIPKSMESLKKEISDLLRTAGKPIVFVIDDIDRLQTKEILEVFQFVKACPFGEIPSCGGC